jgi:predicted TIM-barrel fold metal-dependent hydrolase
MHVEHITDTHCHIIDRSRLAYPWLAGAPALDRDWPAAAYQGEARRVGISRALHMEVDVAEPDIARETAFVEALAREEGSLFAGVIAACRPEADGFGEELARAQDRPLVKGFRRVLHVVPDALSQSATFRGNIRRLARADLPFDLCMLARQLPLAIELVDAAPGVRFVLDHCGVPDIAGGGWTSWSRDVAALAERPNVSAKISGVVAYAAPDWTADGLARWIGHVVECFGAGRLVWGGDWPVCTLGGGLSAWVAATRAILAQASADERAAIYARNAERIWKL